MNEANSQKQKKHSQMSHDKGMAEWDDRVQITRRQKKSPQKLEGTRTYLSAQDTNTFLHHTSLDITACFFKILAQGEHI